MVVTRGGGGLEYLWYVNGAERAMGDEGAAWRDAIVPVLSDLWQMTDFDMVRATEAGRAARVAAEQAIRDESIARQRLLETALAQRELVTSQERVQREQVARDTALFRQFEAELRELRRRYETRQRGQERTQQVDTLRAMAERLRAELDAANAPQARALEQAQAARRMELERAREAVYELDAVRRAELQRALEQSLEAVRASERDAAAVQRALGDARTRLQDQIRRLQDAMRRIP
jgi:hypothetical protein